MLGEQGTCIAAPMPGIWRFSSVRRDENKQGPRCTRRRRPTRSAQARLPPALNAEFTPAVWSQCFAVVRCQLPGATTEAALGAVSHSLPRGMAVASLSLCLNHAVHPRVTIAAISFPRLGPIQFHDLHTTVPATPAVRFA